MRPQFRVQILAHEDISLLHGMWPDAQQKALLEDLLEEPSPLEGAQLTEMLELALQDFEPLECGIRLLKELLGNAMTKGMREDVARDLLDGEPWVHHSHLNWHRALYEAGWMGNAAHGGSFTRPRGSRVILRVTAQDDDARALLDEEATPALAARLAAPCMPECILGRLFEDELASDHFPDAEHVAWFAAWAERDGDTAQLVIEGTDHWWGDAEPGPDGVVGAWPDAVASDED